MKLYTNAQAILNEQANQVGLPSELNPLFARLNYPRRGWIKRGIHEEGGIETALQHTAKLALAAASINPTKWGVESDELRRQCIVHELSEILGTDWTPGEISLEEKLRLEEEQLQRLLPPEFPQRARIVELWEEYEKGGLGYYLDKMDAVVTAEYYALVNHQYRDFADEFHASAYEKVQDETLKELLKTLKAKIRNPANGFTTKDVFPFYFDQLKDCSK
jgi:5'-deoxynucleotidase YfbR-like HD superfamily hydrolase